MSTRQQRYLHGGPSVAVEPHQTTIRNGRVINIQSTPVWANGSITCGDCGNPLVFGRDGQYRHRQP
jgi:hypothetical protein